MEPVAFVEIVNSHGAVIARHALSAFPVSIGRAYDCSVILDDPFAAAHHVTVTPNEQGGLMLSDLGSRNGTFIGKRHISSTSVAISGDDVVRVGETLLRVRTVHYQVAAERALAASGNGFAGKLFAVCLAVLVASAMLDIHILDIDPDASPWIYVAPIAGLVVVLGVWIGLWGFLTRVVYGEWRWLIHGAIVVTAFVVSDAIDTLIGYGGFALFLGIAAMAIAIYLHLRFATRIAAQRAAIVVGSVAVLGSVAALLNQFDVLDRHTHQLSFDSTVKAPAFLLAKPESLDSLLGAMPELKAKVDRIVIEEPVEAGEPGSDEDED
jgi:hypothetical protein